MTAASDFTEKEAELITLLTDRFSDRALEASIVSVNRLEGGEEPTLRLTLDQVSSTDFSRERIATANEDVQALADEAAEELEKPAEPIGP